MGAPISATPVSQMSPSQVYKEAEDLRARLADTQAQIAKRKAWAAHDGKGQDLAHLKWLGEVRGLNGRLQARYLVVRAAEKELNRAGRPQEN